MKYRIQRKGMWLTAFLILALLPASMTGAAAKVGDTLLHSSLPAVCDFEDGEYPAALASASWRPSASETAADRTAAVEVKSAAENPNNKALHIQKKTTDKKNTGVRTAIDTSACDRFVVSYRYFPELTGNADSINLAVGAGETQPVCLAQTGGRLAAKYSGSGFYVQSEKLENRWYDMAIDIDYITHTYTWYLDGNPMEAEYTSSDGKTLKTTQIPFRNSTNQPPAAGTEQYPKGTVNNLNINILNANTGGFFIDNLMVTEGGYLRSRNQEFQVDQAKKSVSIPSGTAAGALTDYLVMEDYEITVYSQAGLLLIDADEVRAGAYLRISGTGDGDCCVYRLELRPEQVDAVLRYSDFDRYDVPNLNPDILKAGVSADGQRYLYPGNANVWLANDQSLLSESVAPVNGGGLSYRTGIAGKSNSDKALMLDAAVTGASDNNNRYIQFSTGLDPNEPSPYSGNVVTECEVYYDGDLPMLGAMYDYRYQKADKSWASCYHVVGIDKDGELVAKSGGNGQMYADMQKVTANGSPVPMERGRWYRLTAISNAGSNTFTLSVDGQRMYTEDLAPRDASAAGSFIRMKLEAYTKSLGDSPGRGTIGLDNVRCYTGAYSSLDLASEHDEIRISHMAGTVGVPGGMTAAGLSAGLSADGGELAVTRDGAALAGEDVLAEGDCIIASNAGFSREYKIHSIEADLVFQPLEYTKDLNDTGMLTAVAQAQYYGNAAQELVMVIAQYAADGSLLEVEVFPQAVSPNGSVTGRMRVRWDENTSLKVLLVDNLDTMKPLAHCQEVERVEPHTDVYLLGDSLMADYPASAYPQGGWGKPFIEMFDSRVRLHNYAKGGESAKSFYDSYYQKYIKNRVMPGDYVIVSFMHNDHIGDRAVPVEQYEANLRVYADELTDEKVGAHVIYIAGPDRKGEYKNAHEEYEPVMRSVAEKTGCPFFSMYQKHKEYKQQTDDTYMFVTTDNTHMNEIGAKVLADWAADWIRAAELPGLSGHLLDEGRIKEE